MIPSSSSRRFLLAAALLLVTGGLGWSALSLEVDHGAESMLPTDGDGLPLLRELNATFGSDEVIVVAFHGDDLFSRRQLELVDDLTLRLKELPHVRAVLGF